MEKSIFLWIIILVAIGVLAFWIIKTFKFPKVGSLVMVTGGVKTGKTTFSVSLAIRKYKQVLRRVKVRNVLARLFGKEPFELPLLYSNIPLTIPYVPLTEDLILRNTRFNYRSIILCSEASLICDSQMIKDTELNEKLLLYHKLIGHELKGGCLIYDTQSIADVHYSIKRCLSEYFYIHHVHKWIPFFLVAYVLESRYSEDGSVISTDNEDLEVKLKRVIIPKRTWKKFDAYCYSTFTDNLPVESRVVKATNLKATNIVSFRKSRNKAVKKDTVTKSIDLRSSKNEKKDS